MSSSLLTKNGLLWLPGIRKPALATFGSSIRCGQLPRALLSILRKIFFLFGLLMVRISFLSLSEGALGIFMRSLRVVLPMIGDRKHISFLQTSFNEDGARFSPDSHFIAYESDDSGSYEVYVQPFPASGAKWQISSGGGMQPRWRHDGKELFYLAPNKKLMAVDVNLGNGTLEAGVPKVLFQTRVIGYPGPRNSYECSADGQRFLMNSLQSDAGLIPVTVMVNWTGDLKR